MNVHKVWVVAVIASVIVLLGAPVSVGSSTARPAVHPGFAGASLVVKPLLLGAAPIPQPPDSSVVIVISGRDTQVNTRGFGDIGMQFQNVDVNAPISNDHISSAGNNNITNSNAGQGNTIINNGST